MTARTKSPVIPLLKESLAKERKVALTIVTALLFMAVAQSALLFVIGPLLKALAKPQGSSGTIAVSDVVPTALLKWVPEGLSLSAQAADVVVFLPLSLVVLGLIRTVANFVFEKNQARFALSIAKNLRDKLFSKILSMDYLGVSKRSPAVWMSIVVNDVMILQTRISEVGITFVRDVTLVVFSYMALLIISWKLALMLLVMMPVFAWFMGMTGRRIAKYAEMWQRDLARIANAVLDIRMRFEFIRAQRGEQNELARFRKMNDRYYRSIRKSILIRSMFAPILEFIGFAVFALCIYQFLVKGDRSLLTGDKLVQFFAALGLMMRPLRNIGEQLTRAQEMLGSLSDSFDILAIESVGGSRGKAQSGGEHFPEVTIRSLVFNASEEVTLTLNDILLAPGRSIAVVGPSGGGKSSFLKILSGLVPPDRWDCAITHQKLAAFSNYVSQKPFLFNASLRANLIYGLGTRASDSDIFAALEQVGLVKLVESMPQGLDTMVHQFTSNVSGGQLQRLSIARALLRPRPLLLLDEATSAIDVMTEQQVMGALHSIVAKGQYALVAVTHRLGLLNHFDEVIFLERGRCLIKAPPGEIQTDERFLRFAQSEEA